MKRILPLIFSLFCLCASGSNYLISQEKIKSLNASQSQYYLDYFNIPSSGAAVYGVDIYKLTYVTTDVHGNLTVASGAVYIPTITDCDYAPIISWHHGTVFDKTEVASANKGNAVIGALLSSYGYIVTYPDYLGLGDNEGIHPYHHGDSQATASIDLIRAAREMLDELDGLKDNNQLFITGYSQGGHATMAMHKYIQEHQIYGEFNILASAPMSGAYDMSGAQFDLIFDGDSTYYMSAFIPYLLASYQLAYGNIYQSYDQLYNAPYAQTIEEFVNNNHTWQEWSNLVPANYYEFMQDSVIKNMLADETHESHPILRAMKLNSYIDWVPERAVKMLYSGNDSMVSPQNAIVALNRMEKLGADKVEAINVFPEGAHENSLFPQLLYALDWFEGLKTSCQFVTGSNETTNLKPFVIYPNPAKDVLNISYPEDLDFEIFNMLGRKILAGEKQTNGAIDISGLKAGQYIIVGKAANAKNYKTAQFIVL